MIFRRTNSCCSFDLQNEVFYYFKKGGPYILSSRHTPNYPYLEVWAHLTSLSRSEVKCEGGLGVGTHCRFIQIDL